MESSEYAGKVLVVTGGSRGIGKAIVLEAAPRGARVSFCAGHIAESGHQVLAEGERIASGLNTWVIAGRRRRSHEK